ncbi:hypothetical protein OUY22_05850 [Nonomuraea sp. MCN248]|uniref:Protein kinase domain-containing protein n=2 Tax=Nonomuraea corallina TaxID=2989783 RepID=A0ABT4S707_9ACTN|nr:serine/threonine protein kinase [Nonomuraea corallina]MDA0632935.1 hypothetical protein [Nonomuraea corallina]
MHPLRPGDPEKLGAYVISGRLTDGPRGSVFLGKESDDAPLRVVKLLPSSEAGSDDLARHTGVQRVSSASVARTLEAGTYENRVYVVREHVEGRSLAEVVAEDGPLDADAVERVAVGTLTALTAIHLAGITHRGLTPHNVIIGADGPRVTDIDLGEPAGELGYRAPEQIRGLAYGPYADIFAWAATVVFAATGRPPFGQDEDAVLNGQPELGELAEPLRRVVMSALAKNVAQRPTTDMALLQLLGDKRGTALATQKPSSQPIEGVPVPGVPGPGAVLPGVPVAGGPVPGAVLPGVPVAGGPGPGAPLPGVPVAGMPPQQVPPAQNWGPPLEHQQQAALPPGAHPAPGPAWEAPREQPPHVAVPAQAVSSSPKRKFPMGLAAAVGALALLSGAGLWGANHYAATERFEPAAAAGERVDQRGSGSGKVENGVSVPSQAPVQVETPPDQSEVVVPWATPSNSDPDSVGPMVLPNEWEGQATATPELSTVPTPAPIVTQPVAQPTVTVTAPQAREDTPTPTPTPTRSRNMVHPTVTVTATPTPTVTVTPTPTVTVTPTPTPTVTVTATPSVSATSTQAQPVQNPHTPEKVCGEGFQVQRNKAFIGGEIFLLYNEKSGQVCGVTMKRMDIGKASPVSVTLDVHGHGKPSASGNFEYYAGPVKHYGKGKCVRFSGSVGPETVHDDLPKCT